MNDIFCPKCRQRLKITVYATVKRKSYTIVEIPEFPTQLALECINCEMGFVGTRLPNQKKMRYAVNAASLKEHEQTQWIIEQRLKQHSL